MKLLMDVSSEKLAALSEKFPQYVGGQLLTPLTNYANAGAQFAIDNGCFARFPMDAWKRLLDRNEPHRENCLWVTAPDIVGSARRTLEVFDKWGNWLIDRGWTVALVAQDGIEDLPIPWDFIQAVFIGGTDRFKDSDAAMQVGRAARIMGKAVHVGRVNPTRIIRWRDVADTGDGSGYSRFTDEKFRQLVEADQRLTEPLPLFCEEVA